MKTTTVRITRTINTPPELIFEMLTTAGGLRDWFCREARTEPRQGGQFRVGWWSGYDAQGTYTLFAPPRAVAFTWLGKGEPGETQIRVTLTPSDGATKLTLAHAGFGAGKKWAGQAESALREWGKVLDNLRSVLETGVDLRDTRRPRLGVGLETARDRPGVVLTEVVAGSPAEIAGLRKGDVLVGIKGHKVRSSEEFGAVFRRFSAGQRVPIAFVREGKRRTITVELGGRPMPEIPDDVAALVQQIRERHDQTVAALRATVMPLTDEQAARAPAAGEWSVKQVLAHLSTSERGFHVWMANVLEGIETRDVEGSLPEQFAAVFASAPTVGALLDRFERDLAETRAMVAALTPAHRAYKVRYRRVAEWLFAYASHAHGHLRQIEAAIRAVQHS